jgi:hypothetical protein
VALLQFVTQARRLGFVLAEIKEVIAIRRSGEAPCRHVRASVREKIADLEHRLRDLTALRDSLRLVCCGPGPSRTAAPRCARISNNRAEEGGTSMANPKVLSLCPGCAACPEVAVVGDEVRIGEAGNLTVLKKDEWNVLVELIKSGELTRL